MTEDEGRIYVKKVQSVLVEGGDLYSTGESEETGEVRVIRYRIKNWSQIRAGI